MNARRPRWTGLLAPLSIATYVTWAAMSFTVWSNGARSSDLFGQNAHAAALFGCAIFLAAFMAASLDLLCERRGAQLALVAAQVGAALLVTGLSRSGAGPVLLIVCAAELAAMLRTRALLLTVALINLLLLAILLHNLELIDGLITWVSYLAFQTFAALTSRYARSAEDNAAELQQVNSHLLATRSLLTESARDQERLRLARELHDVAGHKLTALKLNLTLLARDPQLSNRSEVQLCAALADELLGDIRGVVQQMREQHGMNLKVAIAALAAPLPRPRVHVQIDEDARVDNAMQAEAIVRAVQEALTNAVRHASAENVWIVLRRAGARVELDIRDDGRGSAQLIAGSGLAGMRERLEDLGGGLRIEAPQERGFVLRAWLPVVSG